MEELRIYKLSEISKTITKGTTPSSIGEAFASTGVNYIKSEMITASKHISEIGMVYISEATHAKLKRSQLQANDILFSMAGAYLGKTAILREKDVPANTNQAVALIRTDPSICDADFIYYYLSQDCITKYVNASVGQSAQPNINLKQIGEIEVLLPSLEVQKKVAYLLSCIDNKIELNNRINHNLEEQAQALYKSWFIDFEPFKDGKFVESELGMIPDGWSIKKAEDLCEINIGKTPPRKEHQWFSNNSSDVTWISISDMGASGVYISSSSEMLTKEACRKFNVIVVPEGTVLLSFKLTVGRVSIASKELTTNEAIARFLAPSDALRSYLYLTLKLYDYSKLGSTSSIATAVNSKIIKGMPLLCPPADIIERFGSQVIGMFNTIKTLQSEIKCLCEQRDSLLPRLMSGEIIC